MIDSDLTLRWIRRDGHLVLQQRVDRFSMEPADPDPGYITFGTLITQEHTWIDVPTVEEGS